MSPNKSETFQHLQETGRIARIVSPLGLPLLCSIIQYPCQGLVPFQRPIGSPSYRRQSFHLAHPSLLFRSSFGCRILQRQSIPLLLESKAILEGLRDDPLIVRMPFGLARSKGPRRTARDGEQRGPELPAWPRDAGWRGRLRRVPSGYARGERCRRLIVPLLGLAEGTEVEAQELSDRPGETQQRTRSQQPRRLYFASHSLHAVGYLAFARSRAYHVEGARGCWIIAYGGSTRSATQLIRLF